MSDTDRAAFYRIALYLGLERGEAVVDWADEMLVRSEAPSAALIELTMTQPDDVTGLRHALLPFCGERPAPDVVRQILALIDDQWRSGRRSFSDTIIVLAQFRDMRIVESPIADDLLRFEFRFRGKACTPAEEAELRQWFASHEVAAAVEPVNARLPDPAGGMLDRQT